MPLDTLAREAAWKVTGRERYEGIEPAALVLGWTFEPQSWMGRPAVLVGSGLGAAIGLPPGAAHASFQDLVRNPALFVRSMLIVAAIEGRFLACGFQAHAASRGKFGAAPARLLRGRLSGAEKSARGRPAAFAPPDRFRPATSGPSGLRTRWQGTCSPSSGDAHAERIAQGDSGEPSLTSGPGPEQLERLLSCSRDRIYGTGDFLCREGEPADSFFLIWEGEGLARGPRCPPRRAAHRDGPPGRGPGLVVDGAAAPPAAGCPRHRAGRACPAGFRPHPREKIRRDVAAGAAAPKLIRRDERKMAGKVARCLGTRIAPGSGGVGSGRPRTADSSDRLVKDFT